MLAYAQANKQPLENYLSPEHPLQKEILRTLCEMCDLNTDQVSFGIDGCSAPNFAIPLSNAAFGFARLMDPWQLPQKRAIACNQITDAMTRVAQIPAEATTVVFEDIDQQNWVVGGVPASDIR